MSDSPLIDSLTAAVEARPDALPLRLHLAELLVGAGRGGEAVGHAAQVLARGPSNEAARKLMACALGPSAAAAPPSPPAPPPAAAAPAASVVWGAGEEAPGATGPPRVAKASDEPDPVRGN